LRITISGYALNYTTPVLHIGGEPYRALALRQTLGADTAAGTVVQHSIVKYLGHGCFWALALIIVAYAASPLLALAAAGLSAAGLTAALRALGSSPHRQDRGIFRRLITGTRLWKRADSWLWGHGVTLSNIDGRTREFFGRRRGVVFLALFLEIASRMVASLELLILFNALGQPVSYLDALIVNAGSSLILNLLFFIPYDVGSKEGSLFFLAGSVAIMPAAGVFVGIAARCRELLWILVGLLLAALEGGMETGAYPEDAVEKGAAS